MQDMLKINGNRNGKIVGNNKDVILMKSIKSKPFVVTYSINFNEKTSHIKITKKLVIYILFFIALFALLIVCLAYCFPSLCLPIIAWLRKRAFLGRLFVLWGRLFWQRQGFHGAAGNARAATPPLATQVFFLGIVVLCTDLLIQGSLSPGTVLLAFI